MRAIPTATTAILNQRNPGEFSLGIIDRERRLSVAESLASSTHGDIGSPTREYVVLLCLPLNGPSDAPNLYSDGNMTCNRNLHLNEIIYPNHDSFENT